MDEIFRFQATKLTYYGSHVLGRRDIKIFIAHVNFWSLLCKNFPRIVLFYRVFYVTEQDDDEGEADGAKIEYIRSATEVMGSNGTAFHVDDGERLEIIPSIGGFRVAGNPVLLVGPEGNFMYFHTNGGGLIVESDALRGE